MRKIHGHHMSTAVTIKSSQVKSSQVSIFWIIYFCMFYVLQHGERAVNVNLASCTFPTSCADMNFIEWRFHVISSPHAEQSWKKKLSFRSY